MANMINPKRLQTTINFTRSEWQKLIRVMEKQGYDGNLHKAAKNIFVAALEDLDPEEGADDR